MKGDFTRDTFHPEKHFSRVLMQQGRVLLDADFNEQASILLHYQRTLARDLIGPHGGPAGDKCGFNIVKVGVDDFSIGAGHYYVDGILVENRSQCNYQNQPNYPDPAQLPKVPYLVYLDVWERHITAIEDETIHEKALGRADTCNRTQIVWQVQCTAITLPLLNDKNIGHYQTELCNTARENVRNTLPDPSNTSLKAQLKSEAPSNSRCIITPATKYRGRENHLYRIEIHESGALGTATFKWSRDNGSVVTALIGSPAKELHVANARGFEVGNWVELCDEKSELGLLERPRPLLKLAKVEGGTLTLEANSLPAEWSVENPESDKPRIRRWDQVHVGDDGAIPIEGGKVPFDLEDGIQVSFKADGNAVFQAGDYWLIPARADGSIEWPQENGAPAFVAPHGVEHHYAPLGVIWFDEKKGYQTVSLQRTFEPFALCGVAGSEGSAPVVAPASPGPAPATPDYHPPQKGREAQRRPVSTEAQLIRKRKSPR